MKDWTVDSKRALHVFLALWLGVLALWNHGAPWAAAQVVFWICCVVGGISLLLAVGPSRWHRVMIECKACGNRWTKDQYDSEVLSEARGLDDMMTDLPAGWCPSCGEDGDCEEVEA